MTEVKLIDDQKQWNNCLLSQPTQTGIFLQSWEWLDFQEKVGRKIWRIGITSEEQYNAYALVGVCGIIKHNLPLGKCYLYSPRGPVLTQNREQELNGLRDYVKNLATQEEAIFWRTEPIGSGPQGIWEINKKEWGLLKTNPVQPNQTLIIDLGRTENELLSAMHEKTRYNIRLASRRGIRCSASNESSVSNFEEFWQLLKETAKRDQFYTHHRTYYEKMFAICHPDSAVAEEGSRSPTHGILRYAQNDKFFIRLHLAYQGTTPIAGAVVSYFGDTATYLHGASSYKHRVLMSPYALHWQIMQEAKNAGYRFYDLWGIDEKKWPGITRFKLGFGGTRVDYLGTFDLPISRPWYILYRAGRKIQHTV